ncbi:hypothetical protein [Rufibacter roseus]|uniref:Uncharacterized protein n=1 Tax=Rufibacter roseus TaxID=1567108 RepID=A0ABW2DL04_9BACT|nr:hypothetical protein [Rufibacter roseus]
MNTLTLSLTHEQSQLAQELLQKALHEWEVIINSTDSISPVGNRVRFKSECTNILLQALQQGKTVVSMPDVLFVPVLLQLKSMLENQMKIMVDLMQDESLENENQFQVVMRGIGLLNMMHCMTHETLQFEKDAV